MNHIPYLWLIPCIVTILAILVGLAAYHSDKSQYDNKVVMVPDAIDAVIFVGAAVASATAWLVWLLVLIVTSFNS